MSRISGLLLCALIAASAFAQASSAPPDPYKPVLDRLQSITVIPMLTWQAHPADLAHGEDPAMNSSDWQPVKVKEDWKGSRWLRLTYEIPAQLNGYSLQGARLSLDLHVSSDDAIQVSVFSNGNMVARTDEDGQVPITLIENAQPGQAIYSLYPHGDTWREAMTVREGYELNYPLMTQTTTQHAGPLPAEKSFFGTAEDNVVITAIKKQAPQRPVQAVYDGQARTVHPEEGALIIRFYEWAGKKGDIHLNLPQPGVAAWEMNLIDVAQRPLALDATGEVLAVPTNPYEIKTVKVHFGQ